MRRAKSLWVLLALAAARVAAGELPPAIVAGPYLTRVAPGQATVSWETDRPTTGRVEYSAQPDERRSAEDPSKAKLHHVTLTGLPSAALCSYRVCVDGEATALRRFATAPVGPAPFRFAAYGDSRSVPKRHLAVAQAIETHRPAFVVHTGDYVTDGRAEKQWPAEFFAPAQGLLGTCPILTTMGTHEREAPAFYRYFRFAGDDAWLGWMTGEVPVFSRREPAWFAWTYGDVEFFVLNSYASTAPESPQRRWLVRALEASRARWKIALFHDPLYSSGRHGGTEKLRRELLPVFLSHGLDLALVGHDHIYERVFAVGMGPEPSQNALVQVVTGGGGASSHKITPGPWTARAARGLNFCIFDVQGDAITGVAYDDANQPIDQFTLSRRGGRRDYGETLSAESLEFLLAARRFAPFSFPHVSKTPETQSFKLSVVNPYAGELRGELAWEVRNRAWTIVPPYALVRVPPGGKADVAFTVAFEPGPEETRADPVPMAILTSGGRSVAVPGFRVESRPRAPAPSRPAH